MAVVTCSDLSILCVTQAEDCILPLLNNLTHLRQHGIELVICCDGQDAYEKLFDWYPCDVIEKVESKGYIESVLDQCIDLTSRGYVFRIDDDESLPPSLIQWLIDGEYRSHPHWKFNRAHLWGDEKTVITNSPLWSDHQTRLSTRALSYGRTSIHCGSPFGGGELAPYPILHHKFLVKSLEERRKIVERYNSIHPSAGESFKVFSVPEDVIPKSDIRTSSLEFMIGHSVAIWGGY